VSVTQWALAKLVSNPLCAVGEGMAAVLTSDTDVNSFDVTPMPSTFELSTSGLGPMQRSRFV